MVRNNVILLVLISLVIFSLLFVTVSYADEGGMSARYSGDNVSIENGDTTLAIMRISANDTSGLHALILTLIGDYNPIVKDYTYTSQQGYTSHSIEIQPDWSWIMTCALFIIVIYCFLKIVGGILC